MPSLSDELRQILVTIATDLGQIARNTQKWGLLEIDVWLLSSISSEMIKVPSKDVLAKEVPIRAEQHRMEAVRSTPRRIDKPRSLTRGKIDSVSIFSIMTLQ